MVNGWLKYHHKLHFPTHCVLCGDAGEVGIDLCADCQDDLIPITNGCYQCGLPLTGGEALRCGECLITTPYFDRAICGYVYQQPLSSLIQVFKFNSRLQYGRLLSQLMAKQIEQQSDQLPKLLIPIPLHTTRVRERGFNQALELSRMLSKQFTIDIDFKSCIREKITKTQSDLDARQRSANVKRAFSLNSPISASHVAIVDDVMTTGSTANAVAKILKSSGVEIVEIWTVARTL